MCPTELLCLNFITAFVVFHSGAKRLSTSEQEWLKRHRSDLQHECVSTELDIVRSHSSLHHMLKWCGYELDICQCFCSQSRQIGFSLVLRVIKKCHGGCHDFNDISTCANQYIQGANEEEKEQHQQQHSSSLVSFPAPTCFAKLTTAAYVQALIKACFLLIHFKMLQKALIMIVAPYMSNAKCCLLLLFRTGLFFFPGLVATLWGLQVLSSVSKV